MREGINWKDLRVLGEALSRWRLRVRRKLALFRMDNATAVAHANHGADRSRRLTILAQGKTAREIGFERTVAAPHIVGKGDTIADALSRFPIDAIGGNPFPGRELRPKFRIIGTKQCGPIDVDMLSDD